MVDDRNRIDKIKDLIADSAATDGERLAAKEALKRLQLQLDQSNLEAFSIEVEIIGKTYKMPVYTLY